MKAMYKIPSRCYGRRGFKLEISHLFCLFPYISKHWNNIKIKALPLNSTTKTNIIYYNLIYPYISYGILAWGSVYKTQIRKIQVKQNHIVRLIFFATAFGSETEKAKPLLNLLGLITVPAGGGVLPTI